MMKFILISALLAVVAGYGLLSCQQQKASAPEKAIAKLLVAQTDSFAAAAHALQVAAERPEADERRLQNLFLQARLGYKKIEWAAEYFVPATSRSVNGPPVEEVEISGQVFEPATELSRRALSRSKPKLSVFPNPCPIRISTLI